MLDWTYVKDGLAAYMYTRTDVRTHVKMLRTRMQTYHRYVLSTTDITDVTNNEFICVYVNGACRAGPALGRVLLAP